MSMRAERSPGVKSTNAARGETPKKKTDLKKVWPEVWKLVRPRRFLLLGGLVLMAINRCAGLVLPLSTKYFFDNVLHGGGTKLPFFVTAVFTATAIQAITSYSLTQLLSKAAQRLIADMRKQVQQHIGRLSVAFYDANRSGMLVSRIMSDVEGVRNLIGTGLVEFVGGMLTAVMAFGFLLHASRNMTLVVFAVILLFVFILQKAFKTIRPIFRERAKINAEVTGRLTESLGGIRVIKGYHAERREASVFAGGVQRLLENVMKSLTATSLLSFAATTVMGVVGGVVMLLGGHAVVHGQLTAGGYLQYTMLLAFMVAPVFQVVNVGTQLTEALAGLDRTVEILAEKDEFADPNRTVTLSEIRGDIKFDNVTFSYEPDKPVLHGVGFHAQPAPSPLSSAPPARASRPSSRSSAPSTFPTPAPLPSTTSTSRRCASTAIAASSASCFRTLSSSMEPSARTSCSPTPTPPKSNSSTPVALPASTNSPSAFPKPTTPLSANAASSLAEASASACR